VEAAVVDAVVESAVVKAMVETVMEAATVETPMVEAAAVMEAATMEAATMEAATVGATAVEAATMEAAAVTTATVATATMVLRLARTGRHEDRGRGKEQPAAEQECFPKHGSASSSDGGRERLHHNRDAKSWSYIAHALTYQLLSEGRASAASFVAASRKAKGLCELRIGSIETMRRKEEKCHRPSATRRAQPLPGGH
jgi:hypothetical protein